MKLKKKVFLFLFLIFVIIFFAVLINQSTISKDVAAQGINVYNINASVLTRFNTKVYLDTSPLTELDTSNNKIYKFSQAENIKFASANEDYLIACNNTSIQGYNLKTKELIWEHSYADVGENIALSPIEDNAVYFSTNNHLFKYDITTGKELWGKSIYNQIDYHPQIYLYKEKIIYFGDNATYIYTKDKGEIIKRIEPIKHPVIDGENIYYVMTTFEEDQLFGETTIKKYSIEKDETNILGPLVLDGMNNYPIREIVGIDTNNTLYVEAFGLSDPGYYSIKNGKEEYAGPTKDGLTGINILPFNSMVSTAYYKDNFIQVSTDNIYYKNSQIPWKNILPEENKSHYFTNVKLIDNYLYLQDNNKLWEVNLDKILSLK